MSLKDKVKNFGKVILSIPIGLVIAIPFIISLPMILIISIFDLILEFFVTFPREKKFTASNALKKELERLQDDSLPSYTEVDDSSKEKDILGDLTAADKANIAHFRKTGNGDGQGLINVYQEKYQTVKKLLYGCHKLDNDASARVFDLAGFGQELIFTNIIIRWISITPKIFLYLFLRALEAIGLPYDALQNSKDEYKEEIEGVFDSLKSKALILLNRSTIKKEVTDLLYFTIYEHMTSLFDYHCDFVLKSQQLIVSPEDNDAYEEINEKIICKLTNIFKLLLNTRLERPEAGQKAFFTQEYFEKIFNYEIYNLMTYVSYGNPFSQCTGYAPQSKMTLPRLGDADVEDLKEEFSCFIDNLLKNEVIASMPPESKRSYIVICCFRLLRAYIDYGSVFGGKSPEPSPPAGYEEHAKKIATHLSNDIVKTLNLNELIKIHKNKNDVSLSLSEAENNCTYNIKLLVYTLLPREKSLMARLCGPMNSIVRIIERHLGGTKPTQQFSGIDMKLPDEMLHKSASTSSLKSASSSSSLSSGSSQDKDVLSPDKMLHKSASISSLKSASSSSSLSSGSSQDKEAFWGK